MHKLSTSANLGSVQRLPWHLGSGFNLTDMQPFLIPLDTAPLRPVASP